MTGLVVEALDREQRGLRVQRVEDRLDEEEIAAAVGEPARLLVVRVRERVERDVARARIVDVRRDRRGLRRRPERAGDEARTVRRRIHVARGARDPRGLDVHLVREVLQVIVGLRDRRRAERVRLDEIRARGQILLVDLANHVRLRQRQELVVALQMQLDTRHREVAEALAAIRGLVELVALDHRPHRAVDDEDAPREQFGQDAGGVDGHGRTSGRSRRDARQHRS